MLSPDDRHLVSHEPNLPALATLLDETALLAAMRRCPGLEQASAAHCTYLRYKPRTSCLARLEVCTEQGKQLLTAKAHRIDADDKLHKSLHSPRFDGTFPWQTLVQRDLALVVHRFPHDSALPHLAAVHHPAARQDLFDRLLPAVAKSRLQTRLPAGPMARGASGDYRLETLRYKPERRYVARLDCQDNPRAVLKMYRAEDYALARRAIKSLGNVPGLRTASPLGHSDRYQTLLLEWFTGPSLDEWLRAEWPKGLLKEEAVCFLVGQGLAGLHQQRTSKLPARTGEAEIEYLRAAAEGLRWLDGALAGRLAELVPRICRRLAEAAGRPVPIHGDFDPSQVLVLNAPAAGSIGLIDLDHAALGNPAWDLGNFYAHLQRKVCFSQITEGACGRIWSALLAGYRAETPRVRRRQIETCAAARLVQLAHEPFRYRAGNWRARIGLLVDRAGALLAEPCGGVASRPGAETMNRTVAVDGAAAAGACRATARRTGQEGRAAIEVIDPYDVAGDLNMPFLRKAITPPLAEQALAVALAPADDPCELKLQAIRVLRYKPQRRCMIEYTLVQADRPEPLVVLGKAHAKGKHRTSHDRQQALRRAGFHEQCADGITVARPLGLIPQWHLWLQEKLPGQTAWHALQTVQGPRLAPRIARAAYKLHTANMPARRRHTILTELEILSRRLTRLGYELPRFEARISAILAACHELADELPMTTPVGIHRDFYPDQVLVDGGRIHVLDHDLYCQGDAGLDLGNFCGHLIEYSLRTEGHPDRFSECQQAMVEEYALLAGAHARETIEIYTTLTLARHIDLSRRFQQRLQTTPALLALCEQRLAACGCLL